MTQIDTSRARPLDIAIWVDAKMLAAEAAFARHLIMGLKSDGNAITIISPAHLDLSALPLLGSRHLTYKWSGWEHLTLLQQMRVAAVAEELAEEPPDILLAWANADGTPLNTLQQKLNLPTLLYAWDASELFVPLVSAPYVKGIIAASQPIMDRVPAQFPRPVHLVRPGVYADDTIACYDVPNQVPCLVSLDPLSDKDAYEPLLRACRLLADEEVEFLLFAYDTGKQESAIWQLASKLNLLDRISFVPFQQEAEPLLLHGDLYLHVLPSTRVGYRTLEAMAKGLAVLARPDTAADYLLPDATAQLIERPTAENWAAALRELIADQPHAAGLARRAQGLMRDQHSLSRTIEQITSLSRQAAGTPIPLAMAR